jgi:Rrf2 family iron-sulfur cluster assembly transcriptional regulator
MQLTTKGRYAITAMLDLATSGNKSPITLDVISGRQNISLSYLEQLFAKLRKSGLVKSIRGPGGGYLINQDASQISISSIIEAVDENIDLRRCGGAGGCHGGQRCISHNLWCEVSGQIRDFLSKKTLGDVINEYNSKI